VSIQQFIENLNVGNSRMLGRQKYELDRLVAQTAAELPRERRCPADAFVNNDPFTAVLGTGATFIRAATA
jgi:hypothetical protein